VLQPHESDTPADATPSATKQLGAIGPRAKQERRAPPQPGQPLTLRRDADNPHDPNAIAVHADEVEQIGWVPRELAAQVAPELDAGETWSAVVLREQRASPREARTGLTMLLASAPAIELRVAE
jgi:HIRAN domain